MRHSLPIRGEIFLWFHHLFAGLQLVLTNNIFLPWIASLNFLLKCKTLLKMLSLWRNMFSARKLPLKIAPRLRQHAVRLDNNISIGHIKCLFTKRQRQPLDAWYHVAIVWSGWNCATSSLSLNSILLFLLGELVAGCWEEAPAFDDEFLRLDTEALLDESCTSWRFLWDEDSPDWQGLMLHYKHKDCIKSIKHLLRYKFIDERCLKLCCAKYWFEKRVSWPMTSQSLKQCSASVLFGYVEESL